MIIIVRISEFLEILKPGEGDDDLIVGLGISARHELNPQSSYVAADPDKIVSFMRSEDSVSYSA